MFILSNITVPSEDTLVFSLPYQIFVYSLLPQRTSLGRMALNGEQLFAFVHPSFLFFCMAYSFQPRLAQSGKMRSNLAGSLAGTF